MDVNSGLPSILGRERYSPIITKGTDTVRYVIVAITLIFILLFWLWVFGKLEQNSPRPTYFLQCPVGKCATSIFNGEKRCLDDESASVVYDPTFEVCNSRGACENKRTKYAVQEDGSTNNTGVCPTNTRCRCLEKPRCPRDAIVTFSSLNGILRGGLNANSSNLTVIKQNPQLVQGNSGIPLDYEDPITQSCSVKPIYLNRLSPRTKQCNYGENYTYNEVLACIKSEPCTMGRIVFKPFSFEDYKFKIPYGSSFIPNMSAPVACVSERKGLPICGEDEVPVWNYIQGSIICMR
jgi:hypothetical protein